MYCVRHRIAFAAAVLELAVAATNTFPATYVVSFLSTFFQAAWIIIWVMGFSFVIYAGTKHKEDSDTGEDENQNNVNGGLLFLFLVSFYWTSQVIANTVHVTSAGAVATWYFLHPLHTPKSPVYGAFRRAVTTSFGSICFGSFLVAVIQALKAMVHMARENKNDFIRCCLECILNCIEDLLEYFNLYAFTRVAIYGLSYCQSAKETWELFKRKGFDAIINDDLIHGVLILACLFAGAFSAVIVAVVVKGAMSATHSWGAWVAVAFLCGFALTLCALVVVRSGVATIFVCFAEDPAVLSVTKPKEYDHLTTAWRQRYGKLPARLTNPS